MSQVRQCLDPCTADSRQRRPKNQLYEQKPKYCPTPGFPIPLSVLVRVAPLAPVRVRRHVDGVSGSRLAEGLGRLISAVSRRLLLLLLVVTRMLLLVWPLGRA